MMHKIFLVLTGKMIFLFPENMILFFTRKVKDDLSQKKIINKKKKKKKINKNKKKTRAYYVLFSFLKKIALEYDLFVISGKIVFLFSRKYDIFCLDGN